jgi:hypothetical protein
MVTFGPTVELLPFVIVNTLDVDSDTEPGVNEACLLLKVFQSLEERYPETDVEACLT